MAPKAWATSEKLDKMGFMKFKLFVHQRTQSREWKDNLYNEKKYLQIVFSSIQNMERTFTTQQDKQSNSKMDKGFEQKFLKNKSMQMINKHMKTCSA